MSIGIPEYKLRMVKISGDFAHDDIITALGASLAASLHILNNLTWFCYVLLSYFSQTEGKRGRKKNHRSPEENG